MTVPKPLPRPPAVLAADGWRVQPRRARFIQPGSGDALEVRRVEGGGARGFRAEPYR